MRGEVTEKTASGRRRRTLLFRKADYRFANGWKRDTYYLRPAEEPNGARLSGTVTTEQWKIKRGRTRSRRLKVILSKVTGISY